MRRMIPLVAMVLAAGAGSAVAQPQRMPPQRMPPQPMPPQPMPPQPMPPERMPPQAMPPQPSWDSRGWVPLGERTVNGRVDHDRIEVGTYEGKFAKLTMVVENSDLELIDFKIVFGDRTEYHPAIKQVFREGQRTRALDLPPREAVIRFIDFKYRNLPGGGEARVQVWGWRTGDAAPPPPAPPPVPAPMGRHSWDTRGWTLLGSRQVNGRADRDRIEVGTYEGKFAKLTMAVEDSDLELVDFRIEFDDRTEYHPKLQYFFKEGQRSRVIDLPPSEHAIRAIDITYKNTRGGGPASVEVWGLRTGGAAPAPAAWDRQGWTLLGEQRVNGRRADTDKIRVSRYEPKFRKLTVVVLDSDLELLDLSIKFGRGEPFHPDVRAVFREDSRTRVIDLPGDERVIKWIEFKYRNLPGGGRARVQVWAK